MSAYEGPTEIGYANFPGRGTSYHFTISGHDIQIAISPKRKNVRVFVDHEELKRETH